MLKKKCKKYTGAGWAEQLIHAPHSAGLYFLQGMHSTPKLNNKTETNHNKCKRHFSAHYYNIDVTTFCQGISGSGAALQPITHKVPGPTKSTTPEQGLFCGLKKTTLEKNLNLGLSQWEPAKFP